MSAELRQLEGPELPVEKAKLDKLWGKAWDLIQEMAEHPTRAQLLIQTDNRIIRIETESDMDSLARISIMAWKIHTNEKIIFPKIVSPEASFSVYDAWAKDPRQFEMRGESNPQFADWVDTIDFILYETLEELPQNKTTT